MGFLLKSFSLPVCPELSYYFSPVPVYGILYNQPRDVVIVLLKPFCNELFFLTKNFRIIVTS